MTAKTNGVTETPATAPTQSTASSDGSAASRNVVLPRTLVWLGIAGASAVLTFFVVRASIKRAPADETTERIQTLIDEANRLIKTLEEKR